MNGTAFWVTFIWYQNDLLLCNIEMIDFDLHELLVKCNNLLDHTILRGSASTAAINQVGHP